MLVPVMSAFNAIGHEYDGPAGRDSSVGIANRYGLHGPGIKLVQAGPGARPASYTLRTKSFPGVKQPGRDVDHPPSI
jgi:hypothetical protein